MWLSHDTAPINGNSFQRENDVQHHVSYCCRAINSYVQQYACPLSHQNELTRSVSHHAVEKQTVFFNYFFNNPRGKKKKAPTFFYRALVSALSVHCQHKMSCSVTCQHHLVSIELLESPPRR